MCVLQVSGKKFDPARYLATSQLKPYSVFRAGESRSSSQPEGEIHDQSGFKVDVSRGTRQRPAEIDAQARQEST